MEGSTLRKLQRHFDGIAKAYYDIVDSVWYFYGYFHQRELQFLREMAEPKLRLAVDAGCGPGRHTIVLTEFAERILAVDISREMLMLARNATSGSWNRVEFVQADVMHLPLRLGVASLVVNFEVLEHLPGGLQGVGAALKEFRRILPPGGKLVTEVTLRRHGYMNLVYPPSLKELRSDAVRKYYERAPLIVAEPQDDREVTSLLNAVGFVVKTRMYVRVLPSGVIERFPHIVRLDAILERIPFMRRLAREVILLAQAV